ncbi:nitrogenase iron-molybdenum cofactor biosynthesis protein NifN [Rhodopseudomonas sp. BR0C11]|uniref:nitrogenase iron-molybdenum cofactor biosynthesis protein NifN n=1 Tax=Rhodopseudomonas sp. BR0C11 TaxID=2269370 RepID=UPI0013E0D95D|nr:nitrogenase iron-molybdenum cofactor biosynthesis protein NifN [Rhodopseudomonas sp. BR0C11]NEV76045.1 nitrogenase iron-molybdenum cofactor biosynthesis protein NifN [Rhodopseudomonas sp. BR0C11]
MAQIVTSTKSCTVNPLRMSQPLGAALAFMGLRNCMPLLHGSQGCTSFGLVLFVRHFRESIPLQTTAMSEVATVLGGFENVEEAIVNIVGRTKPDVIGICTTGVTEIKGDDLDGYIKMVRANHPELANVALVPVSTPDFKGAFEDGFAATVTRIVESLVEAPAEGIAPDADRVNVLAGSHLTPGDIDELRDIIEAFGLTPTFLPDISGSLDGHLPDDFTPTTHGGVSVAEVAAMGGAAYTLAFGEQMRKAAVALETKAGVPFTLLARVTGLAAADELMATLAKISGRPVPPKYRRQRSQLVDAMLDGHFYFGGKSVAIGAEPDMLLNIGGFLADMGCTVSAAVTTTTSPILAQVPSDEVLIGDLEDLERRAEDCDLLVTHSHGRQAAERLGVPLFRMGLPMFDRLGAAHQVVVGYRGTRDLIFAIGNVFIANIKEPDVNSWRSASARPDQTDAPATAH